MSRKPRQHHKGLPATLRRYADSRALDFHQYSKYHMRLMDGGFTVLDVWTTGRYYILATDYLDMVGTDHIERAGEKGNLNFTDFSIPGNKPKLYTWLDRIFFPEESN